MADTSLDILIRAVLDAKGFDDLQLRLRSAASQTQAATSATSEFRTALSGLGSTLALVGGVTLGAAEAFGFLRSSFFAAVEASRAFDQMRAANESLAGALGTAREANEEWLHSVETASGRLKGDLVPSYVRLVAVTGSVSEAQRLLQIAAGASAKGFGDVGQITQALIRYYETGQTQTRGFGAVLRALVGDSKDVGEGFEKLTAKFGDAGGQVDNLGLKMDRLHVRLARFKEGVGGFIADVVDVFADTTHVIDEMEVLTTSDLERMGHSSAAAAGSLNDDASKIKGGIDDARKSLEDFANEYELWALQAKNASASNIEGIRAQLAVYRQMAADPSVQALTDDKKKAELNAKIVGLEKQLTSEIKSELSQRQSAAEGLYNEQIKRQKLAAASEQSAIIQTAKIYRVMADDQSLSDKQRLDAAEKYAAEIQKLNKLLGAAAKEQIAEEDAKYAAVKKTGDEFIAAQYASLEAQRKATAERIKLDLMEDKQLKDLSISELNDRKKRLAEDLALVQRNALLHVEIEAKTAEQILAIRQKLQAITDEINNHYVAGVRATTQASIAISSAAFAHNKDLAIAQALINASGAIVAIWGDPGQTGTNWYVRLAETIATAAATAAEIANIENTNVSSGFDDPANDFAAIAGGRKWAKDMVGYFGQGASSGFSQEMMRGGGGSVSNVTHTRYGDRRSTINVQMGMVGSMSDIEARRFVRDVIQPHLNVLELQRTLR